jgi:hypothetical protein
MAATISDDHRVNVRLPKWMYDDIARLAEQSGWDVSKQIRFELAHLRGKAQMPTLPDKRRE